MQSVAYNKLETNLEYESYWSDSWMLTTPNPSMADQVSDHIVPSISGQNW